MVKINDIATAVLSYDYRFSPLNPKRIRSFWLQSLHDFLELRIDQTIFRISFHSFAGFKVKCTKYTDVFYFKLKSKMLFSKRTFKRKDILFLFFLLLSYFPLHPKYYKKVSELELSLKDDNEKEFWFDNYQPSSWLHPLMKLLFQKRNNSCKIFPIYSHIVGWLERYDLDKKRLWNGKSMMVIIRSERFVVHFFYRAGGHFVFTYPREEFYLDQLYVLLVTEFEETHTKSFFWCKHYPKSYKTLEVPMLQEFLFLK